MIKNLCVALVVGALSLTSLIGLSGTATAAPSNANTYVARTTAQPSHTTSRRLTALAWALRQRGKPYIYGGTGPRGFDCSGLVMKSYAHAGISLPRTADRQRASHKVYRISKARAKDGDLVFWGYGHVEFYYHGGRYGAHHSGTRISHESLYGSPAFYHVKGTG